MCSLTLYTEFKPAEYIHPSVFSPLGTSSIHTEYVSWSENKINFRDIGFSLNVPNGAVLYGQLVKISVWCCFNRHFTLPEGLQFVSPVYCIHTTPVTQFRKPVKLSLDHWARVEDESSSSKLSFVFAPLDFEDSEIPFELKAGGHFSARSGTCVFSMENFYCVGIARWPPAFLQSQFVQHGECSFIHLFGLMIFFLCYIYEYNNVCFQLQMEN